MEQYSVLMPVYYKEHPEYFEASIQSMLFQSIRTDDFVIVCDGPLTAELDGVIRRFTEEYPELFRIVRLRENRGLGIALQEGISACRHELIARMDSDDISVPERCEKQLAVFAQKDVAIVGGNVDEFTDAPFGYSVMPFGRKEETSSGHNSMPFGGKEETLSGRAERDAGKSGAVRRVPETDDEIRLFAKRRNPFNHPSVMFRKSAVQKAGGYMDAKGFEDYYLWVRMLKLGMMGYNIQEILVHMRTDAGMYERRGSLSYAVLGLRARWRIYRTGYSGIMDFLISAGGQIVMSLIPVKLRTWFYGKFLRK